MNPADFDLQPSDVPQPKEVDEELATRDWPMPPARAWAPLPPLPEPGPGSFVIMEPPRAPSLWAKLTGVFR